MTKEEIEKRLEELERRIRQWPKSYQCLLETALIPQLPKPRKPVLSKDRE